MVSCANLETVDISTSAMSSLDQWHSVVLPLENIRLMQMILLLLWCYNKLACEGCKRHWHLLSSRMSWCLRVMLLLFAERRTISNQQREKRQIMTHNHNFMFCNIRLLNIIFTILFIKWVSLIFKIRCRRPTAQVTYSRSRCSIS